METNREKYIVRSYDPFNEKRTKTWKEAVEAKKQFDRENPVYCHIFRIPFRKRHPDFPLWISTAALLFVTASRLLK